MTVDSELVDRVILVHTELVTQKQWTSSLNRGEQCRNDVSFVQAMALCYLYIFQVSISRHRLHFFAG